MVMKPFLPDRPTSLKLPVKSMCANRFNHLNNRAQVNITLELKHPVNMVGHDDKGECFCLPAVFKCIDYQACTEQICEPVFSLCGDEGNNVDLIFEGDAAFA